MTDEEIVKRLEARLGADIPTAGQVIRWFGAKTPEGMLVLAVAFCVGSIGLWILGHALKNLGFLAG